MPRSRISAPRVSSRATRVSSTTSVWAVGRARVREAVDDVKSANRTLSTTVEAVRPASRTRPQTRSTSAPSTARTCSGLRSSGPRACWAPIDRRRARVSTRRGSSPEARVSRCVAAARPTSAASSPCSRRSTSAIVRRRTACRRSVVLGPTPHRASTGNECRKRRSSSRGTTRSPSGLAMALATLARYLVRATPTEMGRPARSRTSRRSWAAMVDGRPRMRRSPPTSRKASSMDTPSTSGVVSAKTAKTSLLAAA